MQTYNPWQPVCRDAIGFFMYAANAVRVRLTDERAAELIAYGHPLREIP